MGIMLNSKTDYFFVIIFFIVTAAFLGISIVNIIDKKLSNISINVPKIKLPASEVTVNFEKNGKSYKVKCDKTVIKTKKNKVLDLDLSHNNKKEEINLENDYQEKETTNDYQEKEIINDYQEKEMTNDLTFSDLESEFGEEESDINEVEEMTRSNRIIENMTGLTAEQFYNKHYVNPYQGQFRTSRKKEFLAYNNIDYQ